MFQKIKEFLFGKLPVEQTPSAPVEAVPYKVEAPAPAEAAPVSIDPVPLPTVAQCGCGRSPTGLCVGLHKLSADEWAVHADNPAKVVPAAPAEPAKKKATPKAAVKAAPKKPAAIKAAPKKAAPKKPAAK
jgi:hypothetical protein